MSAIVEAELISSPMLVPHQTDLPPLTFKQRAYINHYLDPENQRNGTQAAIKAGYTDNPEVASAISVENLRKPSIQAHIQYALKSRHISPDEVVAELSDIALLPKNALQSPQNPDSPYNASHKLKALEFAGKLHQLWDKSPDSDLQASNSLLKDLLVEIAIRARQAQVESAPSEALSVAPSVD